MQKDARRGRERENSWQVCVCGGGGGSRGKVRPPLCCETTWTWRAQPLAWCHDRQRPSLQLIVFLHDTQPRHPGRQRATSTFRLISLWPDTSVGLMYCLGWTEWCPQRPDLASCHVWLQLSCVVNKTKLVFCLIWVTIRSVLVLDTLGRGEITREDFV